MNNGILPEPPQPSVFRTCEKCGRRFALVLVLSRADEKVGKLDTYTCKYCRAEITFAEWHPEGAV